ncbi:MAG: four helix bundle protein [Gemmatimonadales bacterium]
MRDHTSLLAWQEAEAVAIAVIGLSRMHWRPFAAAIFDQLQRASVSAQVNISEGYAWTNSPTFRRHLHIAYGSAVECGDLLGLLEKAEVIPLDVIQPLRMRCNRAQRLILGLIRRTARTPGPA